MGHVDRIPVFTSPSSYSTYRSTVCVIYCRNGWGYSWRALKHKTIATQLDPDENSPLFCWKLLEASLKFHLFTREGWLKPFITRNASLFKENSMGLVNLGLGDYKKNGKKWRECSGVHMHAQTRWSETQFISWQKLHRPSSRTHLRALMWKVKAIRLCEPPHIPRAACCTIRKSSELHSIKQVTLRFTRSRAH